MKYTIEGFSQAYAATLKDEKNRIDCTDLVILRWFIDFQAQGRYMLPVLIFAANAVALKPENTRQKWFQIYICAAAVLSLYSFGAYCIPNIQPPY